MDRPVFIDLLEGVDNETAALILQLHLDDATNLERLETGEAQNNNDQDGIMAVRTARDDIQRLATVLADNTLANAVGTRLEPDDNGDLVVGGQMQEYLACTERFHTQNVAEPDCHHIYCVNCIRSLFNDGMRDESAAPVKCCGNNIDVEAPGISRFVTEEVKTGYVMRVVEVATANRIYCANRLCLAFIPPLQTDATSAECLRCHESTCVGCKALKYEGECAVDETLTQVEELAKVEKWQRCPKCKHIIELMVGCYHMS